MDEQLDPPGRPPGLRLMLYDRTCRGRGPLPGLSAAWGAGGRLYRSLGKLDAYRGVGTWEEGLEWLAGFQAPEPIGEIQFWGHGNWGCALVDRVRLDLCALSPNHRYHPWLRRIRERMVPTRGLWWFRTCESFGAPEGQLFAREWTRFFGCRAAGHTYLIGPLQSGLRVLACGEEPAWSPEEGIAPGSPRRAQWSRPGAPRTISCFQATLPEGPTDGRPAGPAPRATHLSEREPV